MKASEAQPMVDVLQAYPNRFFSSRKFEGFWLISGNERADENHFAAATPPDVAAAVLGTLVDGARLSPRASDGFGAAWQREGAACLPGLEGAFVAVHYDAQRHSLHLANDKFGMRPLFVCESERCVAFSNELEPLLHMPGRRIEIDHAAVASFFSLGTTLGEQTFVSGIRNLAAATHLSWENGRSTTRTYWRPDIAVAHDRSLTAHAGHIAEVMRTVVAQLPAQLTNMRCLVSAGADTRLILSCLPADCIPKIEFFTSSLSVLPIEEDRDVIGAQALAERLNLPHRVEQIAFSELEFGPDYFGRVMRSRYRQLIGGWHGGEFLGGYSLKASPLRQPPTLSSIDDFLRNTFRRRFRGKIAQHPWEVYSQALAGLTAENKTLEFHIQQFGRAFFTTIYHGSRGSWLQPYDIVNQGFSPFWDSRFLQALLTVPPDFLADYALYAAIFRDHLPALTDIPSNSPLTQRADSPLTPMTAGREPKVVLQPRYQVALETYRNDRVTWRRSMYRPWRLRKPLQDENARLTMQFIDFEAWWRRFAR